MSEGVLSAIMLIAVVVVAAVGRKVGERLGDRARIRAARHLGSQGLVAEQDAVFKAMLEAAARGYGSTRLASTQPGKSRGDQFEEDFRAYQEARGAGPERTGEGDE